jgi:hypothetical protein
VAPVALMLEMVSTSETLTSTRLHGAKTRRQSSVMTLVFPVLTFYKLPRRFIYFYFLHISVYIRAS